MKHHLIRLVTLLVVILFAASSLHAQELKPVRASNGQFGYANESGKLVIPYKYKKARDFRHGLAPVMVFMGHCYGWAYIDTTGKTVIPAMEIAEAYPFSEEGLALVQRGGRWGYIDKSGKFVIPCKYEDGFSFNEGLAAVKSGRWGFINPSGETIIPFLYTAIKSYWFKDGLAQVMKVGNTVGYIDHQGNWYDTQTAGERAIANNPLLAQHKGYSGDGELLAQGSGSNTITSPPILNIVPGSLQFVDKTGDRAIGAEESCQITFRLTNSGKGAGRGCQVKTTVEGTGVEVKALALPEVGAGETISVTLPVTASQQTVDGEVRFKIAVTEPHGFGCDPVTLAVQSKAFEMPHLKITDHLILAGGGSVQKRTPFDVQFVMQNTMHGLAEDVQVELDLPEHVMVLDGSLSSRFASLSGGDKRELRYTLITNNNYTAATIPIRVKIREKHGRYAESYTLNVPMAGGSSNDSMVVIDAIEREKEEISLAQLGDKPADIDLNIPTTEVRNDKAFAVIIANENYRREERVEYALNDGEVFRNYCEQTLGIPSGNIHLVKNATLNDLNYEIDWLCQVAKAYGGEAKILFYYAGHGVPDESSRTAYLLPVDGYGNNLTTGYRLQELYDRLSALPTQRALVLLDACFSGAQRDGKMMASARGIAIAPEPDAPKGNLIVFSATQGDQTAYPYREMKHGMFTYFLLKKLQETRGEVTLGELTNYVSQEVERRSIVVNHRKQTPTVAAANGMATQWQTMSLR